MILHVQHIRVNDSRLWRKTLETSKQHALKPSCEDPRKMLQNSTKQSRKKNPGECRSLWLHTASSMKVVASVLISSNAKEEWEQKKNEKTEKTEIPWENFSKTEVEKRRKRREQATSRFPTKARANDRPPFSELVSHKTTCSVAAEDWCRTKLNNVAAM